MELGGFFILFACSMLSLVVASAKNRSGLSWAFIGFFTGPLGLIAIAGMPVKSEP